LIVAHISSTTWTQLNEPPQLLKMAAAGPFSNRRRIPNNTTAKIALILGAAPADGHFITSYFMAQIS
jgi:hypothetical protein